MWKKRLAIIGNGMGTCRLLDELTARGAHVLYEITVYGEEPGGAYNRIMLGRVLGGERPDEIVTKTPAWYDRHAIRLLARTRVTRLDTLRKTVHTEDGLERRYDLAVFATGSEPVVPPLDGLLDEGGALRRGAFVYRTVADCLRIRQHARPGDSAVVVGGTGSGPAPQRLGADVRRDVVAHGAPVRHCVPGAMAGLAQADTPQGMTEFRWTHGGIIGGEPAGPPVSYPQPARGWRANGLVAQCRRHRRPP